jgi:hypothetical protein
MLFAQPLEWYADTPWGLFGVYTNSSHGSTLLLGHAQLWVRCEFETARIILISGSLLILTAATSLVIWTMGAIWDKVIRARKDRV